MCSFPVTRPTSGPDGQKFIHNYVYFDEIFNVNALACLVEYSGINVTCSVDGDHSICFVNDHFDRHLYLTH